MKQGRGTGKSEGKAAAARANGAKGGRPMEGPATVAEQRAKAKLAREQAQAIREAAKAKRETGELCRRAEAVAEVQRLARLVRVEVDRAPAYLDPGLSPDVRTACEAVIATVSRKLLHALAESVRG